MPPEFSFPIAPNWPKIRKIIMTSQFSDITSSSIFFHTVLFLLSSLVISPNFTSTSSLFLELRQFSCIRDIPLGNTFVWVLPNIWRLDQVRDTKFGTDVFNKILLNAAKCQGYSFYRFCVIKGKLTPLPD